MLIWFCWTLAAFGPAIIVLALGIRAARLETDAARYDFSDARSVLGWTIPGIVVLAGLIIPAAHGWQGALRYILPLIVFFVFSTLLSFKVYLKKTGGSSRSVRSTIRVVLYGSRSELAMSAFILAVLLLDGKNVAIKPSVPLFIELIIAGYFGDWIAGRLCYRNAKWEQLVPCELTSRAAEIGKQAGAKIYDVRIMRNMPMRWIGAFANNESCIVLTEELVQNLKKDEVDAVIAHEAGHCADKKLWDDNPLTTYGTILAGFALAAFIEAKINALAPSFHWLNNILWMFLFIVPPLAWRWYCRRVERNATRYPSMLKTPHAVISSHFKLGVLNNIPLSRPWWSRILSTHPTLQEIIEKDARAAGITDDELDNIVNTAKMELDQGLGEKYQLVYYEEACGEKEKRPEKRWQYKVVQAVSIAAGLVIVVAMIVMFDGLVDDLYMPYMFAASIAIGFTVIIGSLVLYRMAAYQKFRRRIDAKLKAKYSEHNTDGLLLVDALFLQDWDGPHWQGALMGVRDGKLVLLGETRQLEIDLQSRISLQDCTESGSFDFEKKCIIVYYEVEGTQQWFAIKPLGKGEKGTTRSVKQLESFLRNELVLAEVSVPERPRLTRRQKMAYVTRTLVACAVFAAMIAIIDALREIKEWKHFLGGYSRFIIIYFILLPGLLSWISRAPASVKEESKETSPQDE